MKPFALALLSCLPLHAQLAIPQPVMTNSGVEAMLRNGVPLPSVIEAIKSASDANFLVNNYEAGKLVSAGASDHDADLILEAMHQRMVRGQAATQQQQPAAIPEAIPAAHRETPEIEPFSGDNCSAPPKRPAESIPPTVLYRINPKYTESARTARIRGSVAVCLGIGTDGIPYNIRVIKGLDTGLDENAIEAVRQWRFKPGSLNGKPVNYIGKIMIDFNIPVGGGIAPAPMPPTEPHPNNGRKRVFVGESNTFYSSGFSTGFASALASSQLARGSGSSFAFSSAGIQRLAINIMRAIHDNCAGLDVTDDVNTADYFLRMDRDPLFGPAKMAIFDRTRTMVFVASTHSISKDVKRFCR